MGSIKKAYEDIKRVDVFMRQIFEALSWIGIVSALSVAIMYALSKIDTSFAAHVSKVLVYILVVLLWIALTVKVMRLCFGVSCSVSHRSRFSVCIVLIVGILISLMIVASLILLTQFMFSLGSAQLPVA